MQGKIVAYIDGTRVVFNEDLVRAEDTDQVEIETEEGEAYILFTSSEIAGEKAANRWYDMAYNDPEEFRTIVGDDVLVRWALGQSAGPGAEAANSLQEWLNEIVAYHPEEEFASYDHTEREFTCKHPDYSRFTVAYRTD